MSETLFHLPFNEQAGASSAVNTADPSRSALVVKGTFGTDAGHANLHLEAGGYAEVIGPVPFSLDNSFTLTAWIKADATGNPTNTFLTLRFAGTDRYVTATLNSALTSWTSIKIEQLINGADGSISISLNGSVVQSGTYPTGWGTPVGLVLYNDDVTTPMGNVSWSDLLVESDVLVRPQMIGPVSFEMLTTDAPAPVTSGLSVDYFLNGVAFKSMGITVEKSAGVIDRLAMKAPATFDWPGRHGEAVDLSAVYYQPRTITLKCHMKAPSSTALLAQTMALTEQLGKPGTQRLQINVFANKPLVYEVYHLDTVEVDKRWRKDKMIVSFELSLREPDPIKQVLSFQGPGTVTLTLTTDEAVDIHWGDGIHDYDIYGSDQIISHTYTGTGTYYLIIAGLIDQIISLEHNATIVWPLL